MMMHAYTHVRMQTRRIDRLVMPHATGVIALLAALHAGELMHTHSCMYMHIIIHMYSECAFSTDAYCNAVAVASRA